MLPNCLTRMGTRVFMHMDGEKSSMHVVELFYTTGAPKFVHIATEPGGMSFIWAQAGPLSLIWHMVPDANWLCMLCSMPKDVVHHV